MLKFSDIKQMYEDTIGLTVDARTLAGHIYLAEVEIARRYGPLAEFTTIAIKDVLYNLPFDHIETAEVKKDGKDYFNYTIDAYGRIKFSEDGTYIMLYHVVPLIIDYAADGSPSCHHLFHASILSYCLGKYWETKSEGIAGEVRMAANYYQDFYRQINETATVLRRRAFKRLIVQKEAFV